MTPWASSIMVALTAVCSQASTGPPWLAVSPPLVGNNNTWSIGSLVRVKGGYVGELGAGAQRKLTCLYLLHVSRASAGL